MSIDVNVQNDLVIVTESSEDITVNVSNAAGPAGVGVPSGGSTGQVLKKLSNTNYDTYWALDGGGVPYSGATGDVNLGEFQLRAGQLTLDTSPTGTAAVGTTRWNDTIGSSETTLKGGSVILKNGVDLVARVVNKVSPNTTLTKAAYQAVRVSGAQGQRLAVALAQANNDANSADTIGLVTETIATNQEGFIMTVGQLENINTTGSLQGETWVDGDVLYLSPTTAGAITKVKPTGNGHIVVIGYVEYAHANNGKIYVKVMNGWELDELHDVSIVSAANNEALIYESSTALWKNKTIASALGYTPISGTGASGQVAYWNGTNSQTGSNNLFWDAANARLGIGTNVPSSLLDIVTTNSTNATFVNESNFITNLILQKNQSPGNNDGFGLSFRRSDGTISAPSNLGINRGLGYINFTGYHTGAYRLAGGIRTAVDGSTSSTSMPMRFEFLTSNDGSVTPTIKMMLKNNGNLILENGGTFSDGGQRLQVYGDAFVRGSGATSATSALLVQNSSSTEIFRVYNDGVGIVRSALVTGTLTNCIQVFNNGGGVNPKKIEAYWGGGTPYGMQINTNLDTDTAVGNGYGLQIRNIGAIFTTGDYTNLVLNAAYTPPSGNATYTQLRISPTMNQGGGANGITRGLYVNPTLTAAADWRSIEWSNNSGWGLYGAGTANNYLGGNLTISRNQNGGTNVLVSNTTSGNSSAAFVRVTSSNGFFDFGKLSATTDPYRLNKPNDSVIYNAGSGDIGIFNDFPTGGIKFATGGSGTQIATFTAAGRLLLGTTTEGTFLLDVNGTARVSGNTTISLNQNAETSLTISNTNNGASSVSMIYLNNDSASGSLQFGKFSTNKAVYKIFNPKDAFIYNSGIAGDISIFNEFSSGGIKFAGGGSSTAHMTIKSNGRINMSSLPTSATGLSAGDLWNDGGTLKIV